MRRGDPSVNPQNFTILARASFSNLASFFWQLTRGREAASQPILLDPLKWSISLLFILFFIFHFSRFPFSHGLSKRKSCIEPFDGHLHIFHALLFAWHFPCLPAMCSPRHYASGIIVFCQLLGAQCTLPDAKGFSCSRLSSLLLLLLLYAGK